MRVRGTSHESRSATNSAIHQATDLIASRLDWSGTILVERKKYSKAMNGTPVARTLLRGCSGSKRLDAVMVHLHLTKSTAKANTSFDYSRLAH